MHEPPRIALVTGAARGIGAAIVSRLLIDDYEVFAADLPGALRGAPERGRRDIALDVCDEDALILLASQTPRLNLLVNNAGLFGRTPLDAPNAAEAAIFQVNAHAPRQLVEAFLPTLQRCDAPAIISIASVRGVTASERAAAYSVSKAMVIDLTYELAARFAGSIRCNAVAPGDIATGMTPPEPEIVASLMKRIPLGRFGLPSEVADVVAFLASPRARAVNGALVPVDGGFLCT